MQAVAISLFSEGKAIILMKFSLTLGCSYQDIACPILFIIKFIFQLPYLINHNKCNKLLISVEQYNNDDEYFQQFYLQLFHLLMSTQQYLKTSIRKANSIQAKSTQQLSNKSGENQIYLNTILSSFSLTAQPLKNFNIKLKMGLKGRQIDKQQNTLNNKPIQLLKEQETNKQPFPLISHQIKGRINNSQQIRRGVNNNDPSSRKKSCSDKKSTYQIPILNQEEKQSDQDRSPSYIQRLLTSQSRKILVQRILKSKKKEKLMQQDGSRHFSKCTLNKRIFNQVCKKSSPQKQYIQQVSPSKKQSQIAKFFNYKKAWHENKLILSPIKHLQKPIEQGNKAVVDVKAIMKSSSYSRQQFGPWQDQNHHMNMDI